MGLFAKFKAGLEKTHDRLTHEIKRIVTRSPRLDDASLEMHEDYVEWSGWQRTHEESSQILASLKPILQKPRAPAAAS